MPAGKGKCPAAVANCRGREALHSAGQIGKFGGNKQPKAAFYNPDITDPTPRINPKGTSPIDTSPLLTLLRLGAAATLPQEASFKTGFVTGASGRYCAS
ncbi:MAG: hypothetical protein ACRYFZ_20865 [Janthinobacterium lividum]